MGEFARRQPGAFQVRVDDVIPVFLGVLEERFRDDDAGIVDQDRQRPEPVFGGRDRVDDALPVGDVAGDRQAGAAVLFDAPRESARRSARRAAAATLAPAAASISAKCSPMPQDAPVTSATWPEMSKLGALSIESLGEPR